QGVAVNDHAWQRAGPVVLVNGRWLPPAPPGLPADLDAPCVGLVDDEVAYAVLGPDQAAEVGPGNIDECLARWRRCLPGRPAGGRLLRYLWEVVEHNGDEISLDSWLADPERPRREDVPVALVGPASGLVVDPTARLDPLVGADTSAG